MVEMSCMIATVHAQYHVSHPTLFFAAENTHFTSSDAAAYLHFGWSLLVVLVEDEVAPFPIFTGEEGHC